MVNVETLTSTVVTSMTEHRNPPFQASTPASAVKLSSVGLNAYFGKTQALKGLRYFPP